MLIHAIPLTLLYINCNPGFKQCLLDLPELSFAAAGPQEQGAPPRKPPVPSQSSSLSRSLSLVQRPTKGGTGAENSDIFTEDRKKVLLRSAGVHDVDDELGVAAEEVPGSLQRVSTLMELGEVQQRLRDSRDFLRCSLLLALHNWEKTVQMLALVLTAEKTQTVLRVLEPFGDKQTRFRKRMDGLVQVRCTVLYLPCTPASLPMRLYYPHRVYNRVYPLVALVLYAVFNAAPAASPRAVLRPCSHLHGSAARRILPLGSLRAVARTQRTRPRGC